MKKVGIYIDGRNFELGTMGLLGIENTNNLEELHSKFDINLFIQKITINKQVISKNYYRGIPKINYFSENLCKNVNISINKLIKKGFYVYKGNFTRTRSEKGVDVRLALDIVRDSRDNKIDIVFLFSNDTDLLEAIKDARGHGIKVFHCVFKINSKLYSANNALSVNSDNRLILNQQLLESIF
ncbi:MAG: NYN domain-containing protein [Candidatus Gracilibacteria bacterium]|nr:NYN domain-containing protein [Candidatus Gracilibacteria bacterium]MDQ7023108.1 NYN domain-containing protein [Candidatus Gracilibacteria bacterium]